jgi:putative transposase
VRNWIDMTEIPVCRFLPWLGIGASKFHDWKHRFGKANEHNAWVSRDHWLTDSEKNKSASSPVSIPSTAIAG